MSLNPFGSHYSRNVFDLYYYIYFIHNPVHNYVHFDPKYYKTWGVLIELMPVTFVTYLEHKLYTFQLMCFFIDAIL